MAIHDQDKVFNALAIRDTTSKTSTVSKLKGYDPKTILISNKLNQSVDIDCEGSEDADFTEVWTIGNTITVAASTNDYATMGDYFPYMRCKAICATAPTTGELTLWIEKRS